MNKTYGLTGIQLKYIAMITMVIDHVGVAFRFAMPDAVYELLRTIGRLSFPLFCFLIVEGFLHTHDRRKYLCDMLLFALLSEVPFDLLQSGSIWYTGSQNVFFTLSFGILALFAIEKFAKKKWLQLCGVTACMLAATLIRSDYLFYGVALIVLLYLFRYDYSKMALAGTICLFCGNSLLYLLNNSQLSSFDAALYTFCAYGMSELPGALSFLLTGRYNGQRGIMPVGKYFFYFFYPLHLLLLWGIAKTVANF